jgi:hypothetical protein
MEGNDVWKNVEFLRLLEALPLETSLNEGLKSSDLFVSYSLVCLFELFMLSMRTFMADFHGISLDSRAVSRAIRFASRLEHL